MLEGSVCIKIKNVELGQLVKYKALLNHFGSILNLMFGFHPLKGKF